MSFAPYSLFFLFLEASSWTGSILFHATHPPVKQRECPRDRNRFFLFVGSCVHTVLIVSQDVQTPFFF